MQLPARPENEDQRLRVLRKLAVLDTPPEARFDRISAIAQKLFEVPIVLVTLVDEQRQWFKSCVGLDARETSRDISFCGHAILGDELFEVSDALQDSRFADNPLVTGEPGIRFYAGMPGGALDGSKLGTLCLIDTRPRQLDEDQRQMLKDLAALVEEQLNHTEVAQLARELSHATAVANAEDRARADIRQAVESKLLPLLDGVSETLESLRELPLDNAGGEHPYSIRQALLQLQDFADDIEALLDPDGLDGLAGNPQERNLDELYRKFLETSAGCVKQLEAASVEDDLHEFVRLVRKLKGFARAVGASDLVEYCGHLQKAARQHDRNVLGQRMQRFPLVFGEVQTWLEEQLNGNTEHVEHFDPREFIGTVLVVDDEPFVLKVTVHALERMGFGHVCSAENALDALDLLGTCDPKVTLALLDLNMPDVDGIELLRRLDELGYSGDILLFSGEDSQTLSMAEGLARARHLSMLGSIGKPVDPDRLLELLAMRTAKPHRRAASSRSSQITPAVLEAAIDAGELEPWFQPKIDITTRQPVGVEMLARWPRGPNGPVYPDEFIPVAESSGLIDRLTFMLIGKAAEMESQWRAQGLQLKVAVNLSMQSLKSLDFPAQLEREVELAGGRLSSLQLEVTESSLMEDLVTPLDVLLRLRLKKVRLAIDDFGTGHSNLSQLRDLPFDELKLDRSYVRGDGQRAKAILESSVEIAKKMGLSVVAEGVETLEDWQRVERLGCDQVQGWFCAKAMPGNEIPRWLADWPAVSKQLFAEQAESQRPPG